MKKILIKLILGVVLLVLIAGGGAFWWMDSIAKTAIERGGTHALGVDVQLGRADIKPLAGRFELQRFTVANPSGFSQEKFFSLANGAVAVTLAKLRGETVELDRLGLSGMDMRLERDLSKSNYGVILENLSRLESGTSQQPKAEAGKKFVIREVDLEGVTVHVSIPSVKPVQLKLDKITLRDVGSGGQPLTMQELIALLLKVVLKSAAEEGGGLLPADMVGDLQDSLAQLKDIEGYKQMLQDKGQDLKKQGQDALQKAGEDLDKKVDEGKKQLEEGLKGLLPPKKDDGG